MAPPWRELGLLVCIAACHVASISAEKANVMGAVPGESLLACLDRAGIETVSGAHPEYDRARRTMSQFSNNFPTAIVYPTSTEQVQAAVRCARQAQVKVLPRSGNHGNEGEAVQTGAVTLDMHKMNGVKLDPDLNRAWVQGGTQQGKVVAEAIKQSNGTRGFPGGSRPSVGFAGFVLGGGFGGYSRYAGLGADQIIAVRAVDANGDIIVADEHNNQALLWASRGAGGGKFAIITDFYVRLMDVSTGVTNFRLVFPLEQVPEALKFYQNWAPDLPAIITHRCGMARDAKGRRSFYVGGRYMGPIEDAKKALRATGLSDTKGILPLNSFTFKYSDYLEAVLDGTGLQIPAGIDPLEMMSGRDYWDFEYDWHYKFRSLILDEPLPDEALKLAVEFAGLPGTEVEFQALTGAVSSVPWNATGVGHLRTGKLVFILRGMKEPVVNKTAAPTAAISSLRAWADVEDEVWAGPARPAASVREVQGVCRTATGDVLESTHNATRYIQRIGQLLPSVKAYINFRDTDLPVWADHMSAYHGPNVQALRCIKLTYDPENVFSMPMDITPATDHAAADCTLLLEEIGGVAAAHSRYLLASGVARSLPPTSVTGSA